MRTGGRVAVVGGGIFGVTAALHLARAGHRVELFERGTDLLLGASGANQRRLHRGYHYPRSPDTVRSTLEGVRSFTAEFPEAVVSSHRRYVAIANRDSRVSGDDFLRFCDRMGLTYTEERPSFLRRGSVDLAVRIDERGVDVDRLRRLCWRKLRQAGIQVHLRRPVTISDLDDFERVVLATYSRLNFLAATIPLAAVRYQFEVCEKPVVRLPFSYRNTSVIVLDGPFMCVDPVAHTDTFVTGNVAHAIHATTVGLLPLIPKPLLELLDNGLHRNPPVTRFPSFVASAAEFFAGFEQAEHVGSLFTVRAVLPDVDDTDTRPTLVRQLDNRVISIFSGKIPTCVEAARQATRLVSEPLLTAQRAAVGCGVHPPARVAT